MHWSIHAQWEIHKNHAKKRAIAHFPSSWSQKATGGRWRPKHLIVLISAWPIGLDEQAPKEKWLTHSASLLQMGQVMLMSGIVTACLVFVGGTLERHLHGNSILAVPHFCSTLLADKLRIYECRLGWKEHFLNFLEKRPSHPSSQIRVAALKCRIITAFKFAEAMMPSSSCCVDEVALHRWWWINELRHHLDLVITKQKFSGTWFGTFQRAISSNTLMFSPLPPPREFCFTNCGPLTILQS